MYKSLSYQYFCVLKPYGFLSQFTKEAPHHQTLGDLYDFPKDVYPVGRLDRDSEGLLILTNNPSLNKKLLDPHHQHPRTYWVQVDGAISEEAIRQLQSGVTIRIKKKSYTTRPTRAQSIAPPPLPERDPPIRIRKNIPTSWLELELIEGKNRQVRRMCAAVGFPVLRLVRSRIGDLKLAGMEPGEVRQLSLQDINRLVLG